MHEFVAFPWALGGGLYILGACMYMMKVPERFNPGFFDYFVRLIIS
jgi:predicted membrane channel-forming protein YqfA (hemolysin III family)